MVLHKNLTDVDLNLHIPKVHTHVEADVLDLDKYTQAEVDALISAITSSLGDYVLRAGDIMTGDLKLEADSDIALRVDNDSGAPLYEANYMEIHKTFFRQGSLAAGVGELHLSGVGLEWDGVVGPNFLVSAPNPQYLEFETSASLGFKFLDPVYFDEDLQIDGNVYVATGNWYRIGTKGGSYRNVLYYQLSNDSVYVGTTGDGIVLQGKETRPKYTTAPFGAGVDLALLSDIPSGGAFSFLDLSDTPAIYPPITPGDPVGLKVTETGDGLEFVDGWELVFPLANEAAVSAKDTGGTPRVLIYITNSDQIYLGDIVLPLRIFGFNTRPTYTDGFATETQIALLSDIGATPPAAHTHNYTDRALEVVTNGDPVNPEVLFDIDGDVVTIETTEVKVTYG